MNRLKNYVLMAAGFAVVVITMGVSTAGHAIAQAVRAALVSNVDEPGRIPYQTDQGCNAATGICSAALPPVPAGKRLVITNVSGTAETTQPNGNLLLLRLSGSPETFIPTTFQGTNPSNVFVFNQTVLKFYDAGATPTVELDGTEGTPALARFTLSGYLLDCTTGPCAAIAP